MNPTLMSYSKMKTLDFFILDEQERKFYRSNSKFKHGYIVKLTELPKELLLQILTRFNVEHEQKENKAELCRKVRSWIIENHKNWKKSPSEELLFFVHFDVKKPTKLHNFSVIELKCLACFYNLPKVPLYSKHKVCQYITETFKDLFPKHKKISEELLFEPDTTKKFI